MSSREEHIPLETLSAFIDGELDRDELAAAEAHLGLCPACSGKAEDLRRLAAEVASDPVPPVPVGLPDRLARRLDAYESGTRAADGEPFRINRQAPSWRPWRWHGAPLAAAAALLAAGLLWRFWLAAPGPVSPLQAPPEPAPEEATAPVSSPPPPRAAPSAGEDSRSRAAARNEGPAPTGGTGAPVPETMSLEKGLPETGKKAKPKGPEMQRVAAEPSADSQVAAGRAMAFQETAASLLLREGEARIRLHESGRLEVAEGDYSCALEPPVESEAGELIGQRLGQDPDLRQRAVREGAGIDPALRDLLLRLVRVERRAELEAACGPLPPALAGEAD